jgi:multiple sugar transport system ATP-binding protein
LASVSLRGVVKRFGSVPVVHGIDLEIDEGEFAVLLGPSGCGKTTTLRMVAGLEDISAGEIEIAGRVVNDVAPKDRQIAMVFQNYALYPHMTVRQNMEFALKPQKLGAAERDRRIEEAARILGLEPLLGRRPAQLSGGQRQRVAMGRAMVRTPRVFLFDEPLSNLDAKLRTQVRVEIAKLHKRLGTTVLYVTHDQIEAMTLADKIVIMKDGHIEQVGSPEDVFLRPRNLFVATFVGSPAMNLIRGRVQTLDGRAILVGADIRVPLPERAAASVAPGDEITAGVRPSDVKVAYSAPPDGFVEAAVEVVEYLGTEVLIDLRVGSQELMAQVPIGRGRPSEDRLWIGFDPDRIHVFDTASGMAI